MVAGFTLGERARVNWWRVISDLERAGCPQAQIASTLQRSVGWVDYVKNSPEADPKWHDGDALQRLWSLFTGRPVAEVPTEHSGISGRPN